MVRRIYRYHGGRWPLAGTRLTPRAEAIGIEGPNVHIHRSSYLHGGASHIVHEPTLPCSASLKENARVVDSDCAASTSNQSALLTVNTQGRRAHDGFCTATSSNMQKTWHAGQLGCRAAELPCTRKGRDGAYNYRTRAGDQVPGLASQLVIPFHFTFCLLSIRSIQYLRVQHAVFFFFFFLPHL